MVERLGVDDQRVFPADADLACDRGGSQRMVAGDQHDSYARAVAALTASMTSARGGSRIVTNPRKHSSRSASSRSGACAPQGSDRRASASTRSPWPAKLSTCRVTRSRSEGANGRCSPSAKSTLTHCGSTDSGAPLVCSQSWPSSAVEGRHQLALRVEVVLVSAAALAACGVDLNAEDLRGHQQRQLGRVSGALTVGLQVRVVAGGGSFGQVP